MQGDPQRSPRPAGQAAHLTHHRPPDQEVTIITTITAQPEGHTVRHPGYIDDDAAPTVVLAGVDDFGARLEHGPVTHRLLGTDTWEHMRSSVTALLFGHMLRIANPTTMAGYPSDLFHDALILNRDLADDPGDGLRLFFHPRDWGSETAVVRPGNLNYIRAVLKTSGGPWWWIDLVGDEPTTAGHRAWSATFTLCDPTP